MIILLLKCVYSMFRWFALAYLKPQNTPNINSNKKRPYSLINLLKNALHFAKIVSLLKVGGKTRQWRHAQYNTFCYIIFMCMIFSCHGKC